MIFGAAPIKVPVPRNEVEKRRQDRIINTYLVAVGTALLTGIGMGVWMVMGTVLAIMAVIGSLGIAVTFQCATTRMRSSDVVLFMMALVMLGTIVALIAI